MAKRKQLITSDEAKPGKKQHTSPCSDCPWARTALPGWLGPLTVDEWLQVAHGEVKEGCHAISGQQCAGMAIYRRNVCKKPRSPDILVLEADREKVFATPKEFKEHHERE